MAREVLDSAQRWIEEHIVRPLKRLGEPTVRVVAMAEKVDQFYNGGRQSGLLNVLASGRNLDGPFAAEIKGMFQTWVAALLAVAIDAGADKKNARLRAERFVALLEGSLVLARGMGTSQPFRDFLKRAPAELL